MNKSELIQAVAEATELPKSKASDAVDAMIEGIKKSLAEGDEVVLIGFGTFKVRTRAARTGRNPQTKEPMDIPEAKVPTFKPGKALKDAVNA